MPEINNALAAQINVPQIDLGGTLEKIGRINNLNTENALKQQELKYKQGVLDRNDQYYPSDLQTLAATKQQHMENAGRIGSAYLANPNDASWSAAVDEAARVGLIQGGSLEKAQYLSLPPAQRANVAKALQQAGQPSQATIEQTGAPAGNRARETGKYEPYAVPENAPIISKTEAATGGRAPIPSSAAIMGDDEAVRKGIYSPTPEQIKRGVTGPNPLPSSGVVRNPDGSISSTVTPETRKTQESLGEDYTGYKESAKNAAMTKYLLRNMRDDVDRLSTGKGATFTNTARQWIQSAQSVPGVGDVVKKIVGDQSDPVAAFEAVQKNAGQLTRATLKDVDGKAAAEYRMIQSQLPNVEMSERGIKLVTAQMMAPEDYKQAKLQAADHWKASNRGSLAGFEADWNKNISPSTFLFARLPDQERGVLIKNLSKTAEGRAQLENIKRQAQWAHNNGLDEFID